MASPLIYLARLLYGLQQRQQPLRQTCQSIKVVCISDTHNTQPEVPHGDLLIHAGDLTDAGSPEEIQSAFDWIKSLSHPYKVVIAGNHDLALDSEQKADMDFNGIIYLQNSLSTVKFANGRALSIFGSPWTPTPGTWAFQHGPMEDVWTGRVPDSTDILVTHMPPRFHLDVAGFGDYNLLKELWRTKPRLHVFGHVHAGYGKDFLFFDQFESWYECICRGMGGLGNLLQMTGRFVEFWWRPRICSSTTLVNAAVVGGLRNTERRKAVVVSL